MKNQKLLSMCLMWATVLGMASPQSTSAARSSDMPMFGVNLAGAEFGEVGGAFEKHYTYPNAKELTYFNGKGLNLIRLPFKWERLQPHLFLPFDPVELSRIKTFMDHAAERNMRVILDVHNYGRFHGNHIGTPSVPHSAFQNLWTRLAKEFKDHPALHAYGLMNEPKSMNGHWPRAAQAGMDGVRAVDMKSMVSIAGDMFSSAHAWRQHNETLNVIDPANNHRYEAHVYFDNDSSGLYKADYVTEKANPDIGVTRLRPFVEWLHEKGKKGYIGEYGIPGDDPRWLTVLDNAVSFMYEHCLEGTYWAAGPWWGSGYKLSVEPNAAGDRPQMQILKNYLGKPECANAPTPKPPVLRQIKVISATPVNTLTVVGNAVSFNVELQPTYSESNLNVSLEMRDEKGVTRFLQKSFGNQNFVEDQTKSFAWNFTIPSTMPTGNYCLTLGVMGPNWSGTRLWKSCAANISVLDEIPAPKVELTQSSTSLPYAYSGDKLTFSADFMSNFDAISSNVTLEVRDSTGATKFAQKAFGNQNLLTKIAKNYQWDYVVPDTLQPGEYCLTIGFMKPNWQGSYLWKSCAQKFTVGQMVAKPTASLITTATNRATVPRGGKMILVSGFQTNFYAPDRISTLVIRDQASNKILAQKVYAYEHYFPNLLKKHTWEYIIPADFPAGKYCQDVALWKPDGVSPHHVRNCTRSFTVTE